MSAPTTFDASLASLAVRGTLALFGAASGPVPPFDPQRLNAAGSVFLTRPTWRTTPVRPTSSLGAQANCSTLSEAAPSTSRSASAIALADAAQAHRDLQGRKTVGSVVLVP